MGHAVVVLFQVASLDLVAVCDGAHVRMPWVLFFFVLVILFVRTS